MAPICTVFFDETMFKYLSRFESATYLVILKENIEDSLSAWWGFIEVAKWAGYWLPNPSPKNSTNLFSLLGWYWVTQEKSIVIGLLLGCPLAQ